MRPILKCSVASLPASRVAKISGVFS